MSHGSVRGQYHGKSGQCHGEVRAVSWEREQSGQCYGEVGGSVGYCQWGSVHGTVSVGQCRVVSWGSQGSVMGKSGQCHGEVGAVLGIVSGAVSGSVHVAVWQAIGRSSHVFYLLILLFQVMVLMLSV